MLKLKLLFTLIVALGLVPVSSMAGEVSQIVISVEGLACPFCVYGLEKKLKNVDEVQGVTIDLKTGAAVLALKNGQVDATRAGSWRIAGKSKKLPKPWLMNYE